MRCSLVVFYLVLSSCARPEPKKPEPPPPFVAPDTTKLQKRTAAGLEKAHQERVEREKSTRLAYEKDLRDGIAAARAQGKLLDAAGMYVQFRWQPPEDVGWAAINHLLNTIDMTDPVEAFHILSYTDAFNLLSRENLVRADHAIAERIVRAVTNKVVKTNQFHWGIRALEVAQSYDHYVQGRDHSEVIAKVRQRAAAYFRSKLPSARDPWSRYFYQRQVAEFSKTPLPKMPGSSMARTSGSACSGLPRAEGHASRLLDGSLTVRYTSCAGSSKTRRVKRQRKIEKKVPVYKTEYVGKSVTTSGYTPTSGQTKKCIATKNGKCTSWATVPNRNSGSSGGQEVFTGVGSKKVFSHYETKIEYQDYWDEEKVPYLNASGSVEVRLGGQSARKNFNVQVLAAVTMTSGPKRLRAEINSVIREAIREATTKQVAKLRADMLKASSDDRRVAIATQLMMYGGGWGRSAYLKERFSLGRRVGFGSREEARKVATYGSYHGSLPYKRTPVFFAWEKAKSDLESNDTPTMAGNHAANKMYAEAKRKYRLEVTEPYNRRVREYEQALRAHRDDVQRGQGDNALGMMKRQILGLDFRLGSSSLAETDYAHLFNFRLADEDNELELVVGVPYLGSESTNLACRYYIRDDSPDTLLFKLGAQVHSEIAGKPEGQGRPYSVNFGPIATMDFRMTDWMLLSPSLQPNLLQLFGSGSTYGFNRNSVGELVGYLKLTGKYMLRAGGSYAIGAENRWNWTVGISTMRGEE